MSLLATRANKEHLGPECFSETRGFSNGNGNGNGNCIANDDKDGSPRVRRGRQTRPGEALEYLYNGNGRACGGFRIPMAMARLEEALEYLY
jgi:hypothetical protein